MGYSPRGRKESDTTEQLHFHPNVSSTGPGTPGLETDTPERAPSIPCLLEDGYKAGEYFSLRAQLLKYIQVKPFPTPHPYSLLVH